MAQIAAGPPLFLLPGLLCDRTVWEAQIEGLSSRQITVPDFSHADSLVGMAREVLEQAPARFSVAGHSMGGRVALAVMRLAPERVERLALLDTGADPPRPGESEKRQTLLDLADREGMAALAASWLPPMVHPARRNDKDFMARLTAMVERNTPQSFRRQIFALLDRPDATDILPQIQCPTLIGVGRQDSWSPPAQHEAMRAAVPHAQYTIFEDCGHMAPVEAPKAVNAALERWLAEPV